MSHIGKVVASKNLEERGLKLAMAMQMKDDIDN